MSNFRNGHSALPHIDPTHLHVCEVLRELLERCRAHNDYYNLLPKEAT